MAGQFIGALTLLAMAEARAEDASYPHITGAVSIEIQNDYAFNSDDPSAERYELGTLTEPSFSLWFSEGLSINAGLVMEAVRDHGPMENRVFDDHGLFVEVLMLSYETDRFSVYAGKFGPNFSIGFDVAAGVFGADMSEDDLELAEFVGFGGSYIFRQTGMGQLTASASVFAADRSFLSNSVFAKRGRVALSDGGLGNTSELDSFAIALDGGDVRGLDGLRYHIAFARLANESGAAEKRLAIAAEWAMALANGFTMTPLLEYVRFWHADGNASEGRHYFTASVLTEWKGWNMALAYTGRDVRPTGLGQSRQDWQFQVSIGYAFENGLSVDFGYKRSRDNDISADTLGVLVAYGLEF